MMRNNRQLRGFSLVELLTAVGIIALLIGGLVGIPWSNLTKYAKASAVDVVESAVGSARAVAIERGRRAAVIFMQSDQQDNASMITVVESDTPNVFYNVDGFSPVQLPRGTTIRAPSSADSSSNSHYQTWSGAGSTLLDNTVYDPSAPGNKKQVKCFAVAFDATGRLIYGVTLGWFDGNRDGNQLNGANLQMTDLRNIPTAPYAALIDTRALQEANALAFANNQTAENNYILGSVAKPKIVTFNRYSGNALRK